MAALGATLLAPAAAVPAVAAGASFGTPTATSTYGASIAFSVPFTAAGAISRIELRLRFPEALGPELIDIPVPAAGTALTYRLDLSGGASIAPNTRIVATWVAYPASGPAITSPEASILYQDTSHTWRTITGRLVRVHWYVGEEGFARNALDIGEQAVADASALLGVTETDPIDFFIYGDQQGFVQALGPGTRETQIGEARADLRTLFGLITPATLVDPVVAATVPHELVHLVFDTAVRNPYRFPPTWLNEGLAVYLSEGYGGERRALVEEAVRRKTLFPLTALGRRFPSDAGKGFLAYCEGASAIDYLVRTFGRDALARLVVAYADGLTDDEAFRRALDQDLAAFQAGWLRGLGARDPVPFGPAPAPPGPLPPGWGSAVAGQSPAASAGPGGQQTDGTGEVDKGAVLAAVGLVVLIVIAGLVVARRRGAVA